MRGILLSKIARLSKAPRSSIRRSLLCPLSLDPCAVHRQQQREALAGDLSRWASPLGGSVRGFSKFATGFSPLQLKPLDSIIDMERAKNRSAEDLVTVWDDYHLGRGHIGTSMKAKLYYLLEQRSKSCRHFVIPLWRGSGYTNMFIQDSK